MLPIWTHVKKRAGTALIAIDKKLRKRQRFLVQKPCYAVGLYICMARSYLLCKGIPPTRTNAIVATFCAFGSRLREFPFLPLTE